MNRIARQFEEVRVALAAAEYGVPLEMKLRTAELILRLTTLRRKRFGLFVILGWHGKWKDYLDISDAQQDIFAKHHVSVLKATRKSLQEFAATLDFDGAILINRRGEVVHSGVMVEGMRPRIVARKVNPGSFRDLSEQFGFRAKVHTRHLSAIAASYVFKGTTVFTVSEEDGSFHVYEKGRIVYQT